MVAVWHADSWQTLRALPGHRSPILSLAVHPSGRVALSVARDRGLRLWDLVAGRCAYKRRLPHEATTVAFAPDGTAYALVTKVRACPTLGS